MPLQPELNQAPVLIPGIDPVIDQNLAGMILMLLGKTSYVVGMAAIFFSYLARERAQEPSAQAGSAALGAAPGIPRTL